MVICVASGAGSNSQTGLAGLSGLSGLSGEADWFPWWVQWVANLVRPRAPFLLQRDSLLLTLPYDPQRCWLHASGPLGPPQGRDLGADEIMISPPRILRPPTYTPTALPLLRTRTSTRTDTRHALFLCTSTPPRLHVMPAMAVWLSLFASPCLSAPLCLTYCPRSSGPCAQPRLASFPPGKRRKRCDCEPPPPSHACCFPPRKAVVALLQLRAAPEQEEWGVAIK